MSFPGRPGGMQTPGEAHGQHSVCLEVERNFDFLHSECLRYIPLPPPPPHDPGPQRGFKVLKLDIWRQISSQCVEQAFCVEMGRLQGVQCGTQPAVNTEQRCGPPSPHGSPVHLQVCISKCASTLPSPAHTKKSRLPKRRAPLGAHGDSAATRLSIWILDPWKSICLAYAKALGSISPTARIKKTQSKQIKIKKHIGSRVSLFPSC